MSVTCQHCGASVSEDSLFCDNCGRPLASKAATGGQSSQSPPPPPPPPWPGASGGQGPTRPLYQEQGGGMRDFLSFRKMITPIIIQIIFWLGVGLCLLAGLVMIVHGATSNFGGGAQVLSGLLLFFFGPIGVRIYCELLIIFFRMNETLTAVMHLLERK